MSQEQTNLNYLMNLRLLPCEGDDVDYHGDKDYILNCKSKTELRRMIRFLTEAKPTLIQSATKQLAQLEGRSTPPPATTKTEQYHRVSPINRKEEMRRKEEFLNFSRVLLKYLEHKNKRMHSEAKVIIGECIDRNRKQEQGYESVTAAMRRRLKDLVGEHYWERAKSHYYAQLKRNMHSSTSSVSSAKKHERSFVRQESGGKVACVRS